MDTNDIRRMLQTEYDIPFVVNESFSGGEPAFVIGPENRGKELFTIRLSFKNRIRLNMEFVPEKYSAQFIESMAGQPAENRNRFRAYTMLLIENGARVDIRVNDVHFNPENLDQWPEKWNNLYIRVTKMPVLENEENYSDVAYKWGSVMIGMILSLADIVPIEEDTGGRTGYLEGNVQRTETNRYERNPLNRKLCLAAKGYDCAVCGMNFEKTYGEIGKHFIHVHHIVPVSSMGGGYVIDPIKDLVPVCPNCHSMLHRVNPPMMPETLKEKIVHG